MAINKQLVIAFEALDGAADVQSAVEQVRELYDLHHVVYHLGQTVGSMDTPFVGTTYPDEWVSRYLLKGYVHVDPVVQEDF